MFFGSALQMLEEMEGSDEQGIRIVPVELVEVYKIIVEMGPNVLQKEDVMVYMKYKTVQKKVKLVAGPLPANSEQKRREVSEDPTL